MWSLPISMLVATTLLAIPLSRYLAWIMDGRYRPRGPLRCDRAGARQRPAELEAVHGRAADLQHGAVRLRLRRSWRSSPGCRSTSSARGMLAPSTIFHTVVSFMTNTNLQHYSGDQHFSNFSQIFFGIANFFLSASIGFCALTAIIRALARRRRRSATSSSTCGGSSPTCSCPLAFVLSLVLRASRAAR